jgi:hypothetical protein
MISCFLLDLYSSALLTQFADESNRLDENPISHQGKRLMYGLAEYTTRLHVSTAIEMVRASIVPNSI